MSIPDLTRTILWDRLDEIKRLFNAPKVTLLVRNRHVSEPGDTDVLVSDDDIDEAIASIRRLQRRPPV